MSTSIIYCRKNVHIEIFGLFEIKLRIEAQRNLLQKMSEEWNVITNLDKAIVNGRD